MTYISYTLAFIGGLVVLASLALLAIAFLFRSIWDDTPDNH